MENHEAEPSFNKLFLLLNIGHEIYCQRLNLNEVRSLGASVARVSDGKYLQAYIAKLRQMFQGQYCVL
jgi:hypothetical protein